jgi:hypothetical protein
MNKFRLVYLFSTKQLRIFLNECKLLELFIEKGNEFHII